MKADRVATLGDDIATVHKWAAELRRVRKNLENDPRSGFPTTATTEEAIDPVHLLMMDDK